MAEQVSDVVSYDVQQGMAVITMSNAPVNALSQAVRVGLIAGMDKALQDDSVHAVVITSSLALF